MQCETLRTENAKVHVWFDGHMNSGDFSCMLFDENGTHETTVGGTFTVDNHSVSLHPGPYGCASELWTRYGEPEVRRIIMSKYPGI